MKKVTPMELLTLFHRSNNIDVDLSAHEHRLLSALITYINHDTSQGYKAWPSTDTLVARTGMHTSTIERSRKRLIANGWMQVVSGKGSGHSNQYFIDAGKIIAVAKLAGSVTDRKASPTPVLKPVKPHERNTAGLRQGNSTGAVKAVCTPAYDEELDSPF